MMNLYQCFLSNNRCYKTNAKIKPKGVMVHSTGANNPNLKRYVQPTTIDPNRDQLLDLLGVNPNHNDWNRSIPDPNACVHAFIGYLKDGTVAVMQTLPWDHRGWHAGTGTKGLSANDSHISFEICEDALISTDYFEQTYDTAAELVALLCEEYDLDPMADGVIICHQDGYKRGIASNHGDIYNWWPKFGKSMDDFRELVVKKMGMGDDEMVYYKTIDDVPNYYKDAVVKCIDAGAIKGEGDGILDLSEDLCRTLTILDRMGKL